MSSSRRLNTSSRPSSDDDDDVASRSVGEISGDESDGTRGRSGESDRNKRSAASRADSDVVSGELASSSSSEPVSASVRRAQAASASASPERRPSGTPSLASSRGSAGAGPALDGEIAVLLGLRRRHLSRLHVASRISSRVLNSASAAATALSAAALIIPIVLQRRQVGIRLVVPGALAGSFVERRVEIAP